MHSGRLRKVYPYFMEYVAGVKDRWRGRTVRDVVLTEFPFKESYWDKALAAGRLKVNGEPVDAEYKLKKWDQLRHLKHRHEPPVLATQIQIVHEDDQILAVNKPASMPVHPSGRFHYNSVTAILEWEHGIPPDQIKPLHRLDVLTSGILIFCKNKVSSKKMKKQIFRNKVKKEYICRVAGKFPDGQVVCDGPISQLCYYPGLYAVRADGKPSRTVFERISWDGWSSLVRCWPYTGRTHQIRVHLQHLGFPILNDQLYNTEAWGPERGKDGVLPKPVDELVADLLNEVKARRMPRKYSAHCSEHFNCTSCHCGVLDFHLHTDAMSELLEVQKEHIQDRSGVNGKKKCNRGIPQYYMTHPQNSKQENHKFMDFPKAPDAVQMKKDLMDHKVLYNPLKDTVDPLCEECTYELRDPPFEKMFLCLHALRYTGPDWEYETDLPHWAVDGWTPVEER